MTRPLSRRLDGVGRSPTSEAARVSVPVAPGRESIDLGAGSPDWAPPPEAIEAAHRALEVSVGYGRPGGEPELLEAIIAAHGGGVGPSPPAAVATGGGKEASYFALGAVVDPGDQVVVCAPYWPTYLDQIRLFGGLARIVPEGPDGQPDLPALRQACLGAKVIVVNTPGNPSGLVLGPETAETIAQGAEQNDAWLLVDGVYGRLIYGDASVTPEWFVDRCPDRALLVDAASKRLALPGLRIGWAVGSPEWIDGIRRQQDATSTHPNLPGQWAALAGLRAEGQWLPGIRRTLRSRAAAVVEAVDAEGRLWMRRPTGGLFVLLRLPSGVDDVALSKRLADQEGLKCIPGTVFGVPSTLRLALRQPEAKLRWAVARIAEHNGCEVAAC